MDRKYEFFHYHVFNKATVNGEGFDWVSLTCLNSSNQTWSIGHCLPLCMLFMVHGLLAAHQLQMRTNNRGKHLYMHVRLRLVLHLPYCAATNKKLFPDICCYLELTEAYVRRFTRGVNLLFPPVWCL